MNDSNLNVFNMVLAVFAYLKGKSDSFTFPEVVTTALNELQSLIQRIKEYSMKHESISKGLAKEKDLLLDDLVEKVMSVIGPLKTYAIENNQTALFDKVNTTYSKLRNKRDSEIAIGSSNLLLISRDYQASLVLYGVTDDNITVAEDKVTEYDDFRQKMDIANAEKIAARKELTALLKEAKKILTLRLDNMMELYRESEPEMYAEYKAARVIKNYPAHHNTSDPEDEGNN